VKRQLEKKPTKPVKESAVGETSIFTSVTTGLTGFLSDRSLRSLYRETSSVRRCVDHIAESIANLPREYKVALRGKKDEIVKSLFERETVTGETFRDVLIAVSIDMLVLNKGVLVPLLTLGKQLTGFTARDAATFYPVYEKDGRLRGYVQQTQSGRIYKFLPSEVIFVRLVPRTYSSNGLPILESLTYELTSYLKNLVKSDPESRKPIGTFIFTNNIDEDVINRFQEDLTTLLSGDKVKIPLIWGAGEGKWVELAKQFDIQMISAFLDRLDWLVRSAFGFVPPGSNLLQASPGADLMFSTLVPQVAKAIEDKMNRFLEPYGISFRFKIPPVHSIERIIEGTKSGLIAPNEARQFMNLPPFEGGNQVSVLQPKGLTPVGSTEQLNLPSSTPESTAEPIHKSTSESVLESVTRTEPSLQRAVSLEDLHLLHNAEFALDEKRAKFIINRVKLVKQFQEELKKEVDKFREKFEEKSILRQEASVLPPSTSFLLRLSALMDDYRTDAFELGFDRVNDFWRPSEYDREQVRKIIDEYSDVVTKDAINRWKSRIDKANSDAKRGNWDVVYEDLNRLVLSVLAAGGLAVFFANLPLVVISRLFEKSQGIVLRWVGIEDDVTCKVCAAMIGRVFRPSVLELLQTWPGYGTLCGHNCRCSLEPISDVSLASYNKWIGNKISVKDLQKWGTEAEAIFSNLLKGIDARVAKVLEKTPPLREPAYLALFKEVNLTDAKSPRYDAIKNVLELPRTFSDSQIREAFVDSVAINLLYRFDLMDPRQPFSAQLQSLLLNTRKNLWDKQLKKILPSELKDDWLAGNKEAFKGISFQLFDIPQSAYFDPREFFMQMFRASIFSPQRLDIEGMTAFRELLGSTFWTPNTYENWLNRVYKVRPIPWRSTRSTDQIISAIPVVDPEFKSQLTTILQKYSTLRVPSFWSGLQTIRLSNAARYDATYLLDVDYKDFVKSFNGVITTTPNDFQFLHELGHHVFERHFIPFSYMRDAFALMYRDRILVPLYEQILPYLDEKQAQKFMGYINGVLKASEERSLGSYLVASRDTFEKEIFEPLEGVLPRAMQNWALPIRPYALRKIDETFAEIFATFFERPTVLYFSDPELYVFMESLLQNLAVRPESLISKHPLWSRVYEAALRAGFTRKQLDKLLPKLLWAHYKEGVDPEEIVELFAKASLEDEKELRKVISKKIDELGKAPEKKKLASKESKPKIKKPVTVPKKIVTLREVSQLLKERLKLKKSELETLVSIIAEDVIKNKKSLIDLYSKLESMTKEELQKWIKDLLKK